jgi:hypothetical protein
MRLLTLLTAGSQAVTLRGAVEVLVLPSLAYLHSHAGRSLVRVAAQVMRTLPLDARVDPTMPADRQATALLSTLLPSHLPEHLRRERLGVARTLFIELIANRAREIEHGLAPHLNEDEFAREMVAVTTGLLAAD